MERILNRLPEQATKLLTDLRMAPAEDQRNALVELALKHADSFSLLELQSFAHHIGGNATTRIELRVHPLEKKLLQEIAKKLETSVTVLIRDRVGLKVSE